MDNNTNSTNKRKRGINLVLISILAVIIGLAAYNYWNTSNTDQVERTRYISGEHKLGNNYDYQQMTSMTIIENQVVDKNVVFSLKEVIEAGIIYTPVTIHGNISMPLTAFFKPSGDLVVAFSICEPCRSETFRAYDNQLICEACGTIWSLQDLQGISGGCMDHPPEAIYYEVVGDQILVPFEQLLSWTPRGV